MMYSNEDNRIPNNQLPEWYKLNVIAHCKLSNILNIYAKRKLLEGLELIADMFAVVYEVKQRLQINYDVLSITGLDVLSGQCFGTRTSYVNTASWKQDSMSKALILLTHVQGWSIWK